MKCLLHIIPYHVSVGIMLFLNCYSAKLSALVVTILSFVKLIAAGLIIIVGIWQFSTGTYTVLFVL